MITAHRHKTTSLFVYRMSVTFLQMASAVTASATIPVHLWQSSSVSLSGSPSDLRWGTRTVSCATQYSHKHVKQILDRDSHKAVLNNIILLLLMAGICPTVKGKSSLYSITERRVLELILVLVSQPAGDVVINSEVGCHYFPSGLQLPPQPLRGLLPILLLGEHRHNGCEQFA